MASDTDNDNYKNSKSIMSNSNLKIFLNLVKNQTKDESNENLIDDFNSIISNGTKKVKKQKINLHKGEEEITAADFINLVILTTGVVTSILRILIFSKKKLIRKKFNWYLFLLSIFDFIFCVTLSVDYLHRIFSDKKIFLHNLNLNYLIIMDFIAHTSDSFTIILTLILSIDRLYAISYPIKIKHFITNTRSKLLVFSSFIVLCSIKLISSTVNCHICSFKACDMNCKVVSPLLLNILPAFMILVLNSILIVKVIRYNVKASNISGTRVGRNSVISQRPPITKLRKSYYFIIATISLWFLLTNIPYYIFLACHFRKNYSEKNHLAEEVTSILFNLNHCVTFFIYVCFHDTFRVCFLRPLQKFKIFKNCFYFETNKAHSADFV